MRVQRLYVRFDCSREVSPTDVEPDPSNRQQKWTQVQSYD